MKARTLLGAAGSAAVAAAIVVAVWWAGAPRSTRVRVGMSAPDAELSWAEPAGGAARLSQLRGSPVLLGVFDTASPEGTAFARVLERAQGRYRSRGLLVVGVAVDDDRTPVLRFIRGLNLGFPVFHDPGGARLRPAWGRLRVLESYLIDARGEVRAVYPSGFEWPDSEVERAIQGVLPSAPAGKP